ncbi:MAG: hypothetical protein WBD38_11975 [Candidatus Dormiibacterota bacterium]
MNSNPTNPLASAAAIEELASRLANIARIAKLSDNDHDEPQVLAHALADLAAASEQYLKSVPDLADRRVEGEKLLLRLIEVSTQLQHMLYHLEDPRFLRQFLEPLRDEWESSRSANRTG